MLICLHTAYIWEYPSLTQGTQNNKKSWASFSAVLECHILKGSVRVTFVLGKCKWDWENKLTAHITLFREINYGLRSQLLTVYYFKMEFVYVYYVILSLGIRYLLLAVRSHWKPDGWWAKRTIGHRAWRMFWTPTHPGPNWSTHFPTTERILCVTARSDGPIFTWYSRDSPDPCLKHGCTINGLGGKINK